MSNTPFTKTKEYISHALRHGYTGMQSEWTLLQNIELPGENLQTSVCISNILVHPNFGIAILDLMPGPTVSDAVLQVCRVLNADGFVAAFGGLPPVVHLYMPTHALPDLEEALDRAFAQKPPIALQHGATWVAAVRRKFEVLPSTPLPVGMVDGDGSSLRPHKIFKRYHIARPSNRGLRGLLWFWGGMLTVGSISVAVLQYLGPPTQPISGMPQAWLTAEPVRLLVSQEEQTFSLPLVSMLLAPMPPAAVGSASSMAGVVPGQDREQPGSAAAEAVASYDLPAPRTADTPDPPEAARQGTAAFVLDQADPEPPALLINPSPGPVPPEPAVALAPMPPAAVGSASSMAGVVPGQDREQPGSAAAEAVASYDLPAPRTADTPDPPEAVKAVKLEKATSPPLVTIETLIRRADIMISRRDISAARLLYRRAAVGGSHHAMLALGKTYDPFFLAEIGARGTMGDVATAIDWYQRAFALGANDAWERLALHGIHLE
jgi:hypothetical protein